MMLFCSLCSETPELLLMICCSDGAEVADKMVSFWGETSHFFSLLLSLYEESDSFLYIPSKHLDLDCVALIYLISFLKKG